MFAKFLQKGGGICLEEVIFLLWAKTEFVCFDILKRREK